MPQLATSPIAYAVGTGAGPELLEKIQQRYILSEDGTAASFIIQHPELSDVLFNALPRLRELIGDAPTILLQAPFDDAGWQLLYAVVCGPATQIRSIN